MNFQSCEFWTRKKTSSKRLSLYKLFPPHPSHKEHRHGWTLQRKRIFLNFPIKQDYFFQAEFANRKIHAQFLSDSFGICAGFVRELLRVCAQFRWKSRVNAVKIARKSSVNRAWFWRNTEKVDRFALLLTERVDYLFLYSLKRLTLSAINHGKGWQFLPRARARELKSLFF